MLFDFMVKKRDAEVCLPKRTVQARDQETPMDQTYRSFKEFYPFYLSQHKDPVCRALHVVGSLLSLACLTWGIGTGHWGAILAALVVGYAFAWVGHFVFEKNKPATFQYPLYSFMGDWVMLWETLSGKSQPQKA
jgi:hypothetical protein